MFALKLWYNLQIESLLKTKRKHIVNPIIPGLFWTVVPPGAAFFVCGP